LTVHTTENDLDILGMSVLLLSYTDKTTFKQPMVHKLYQVITSMLC